MTIIESWDSYTHLVFFGYADDVFLDDESSVSSMNSFKYSNINQCEPGIEDDQHDANYYKCTRFCPPSLQMNHHHQRAMDCCRCGDHGSSSPSSRVRSYVDVRTQLLQRSLMEELHKRRLFKTVGAIENIGFQEPTWRSIS